MSSIQEETSYVCAVWTELDKFRKPFECSGAVPYNWVKSNKVFWPQTNQRKYYRDKKEPEDSWLSYDLIKIKGHFATAEDAEALGDTTIDEDSNASDEGSKRSRHSKKRHTDSEFEYYDNELGQIEKRRREPKKQRQSSEVHGSVEYPVFPKSDARSPTRVPWSPTVQRLSPVASYSKESSECTPGPCKEGQTPRQNNTRRRPRENPFDPGNARSPTREPWSPSVQRLFPVADNRNVRLHCVPAKRVLSSPVIRQSSPVTKDSSKRSLEEERRQPIRNKGGRPQNPENLEYPLNAGTFQKIVLRQLAALSERLKKIERRINVSETSEDSNFITATSVEELKTMEQDLSNEETHKQFVRHLTQFGNDAATARAIVRAMLQEIMEPVVQVKVNLMYGNCVPGQEYTDRLSLMHDLPNLHRVIIKAMKKSSPGCTEKQIHHDIADYLRSAQKRVKDN